MKMNNAMIVDNQIRSFSARLVCWQKQAGRHDLPWQVRDPYRVWLSEIMLQQTQVATVLDYYPRFLQTFPQVGALAEADEDAVLALWQGLGYYSRARNLHKAARQVMNEFGGVFPQQRTQLETLCGVGRSTAAAIAAFCFDARESILDGNVKRVLCRVFALDGDPSNKAFTDKLWTLAEQLLPENNIDMPAYTQGLMDLGATVCRRSKPLCDICPQAMSCLARAQHKQDELPRKKSAVPVKVLPLFWLVLHNSEGAVWLQKRPNKGIWGGLWCVPCFDSFQATLIAAAEWELVAADLSEDAEISHRLTHRQLLITPFRAQVILPRPNIPEQQGCWVLPQALADYGLPQPLKAYLQQQGQLF